MQGIFCYVGGTDVDDRGAPIEDGEAEDEGLWGSGSPRGSWGFSLPFFSIDSGDEDDEWSADEEEEAISASPKLKALHGRWKTTSVLPPTSAADLQGAQAASASSGKAAAASDEAAPPGGYTVTTATPKAKRRSFFDKPEKAEPLGPLTFTEPFDDDESEPPEDYKTGGYHPMRIGDVIARRYKIERKLGWGVYSTVWLAQDNSSKRTGPKKGIQNKVAIKVQKSAREYSRAARGEIALLQSIASAEERSTLIKNGNSNIVRMLQCFEIEGSHGRHTCMVFEPLGHSLLGLIQLEGMVQPPVTAAIATQLLDALEFLHSECGIMHTDIKPENILLVPGSNPMRPSVKLVDFGNACQVNEQKAKAIQTREYRSPEAILGAWPYTTAVDMWSVGALIFELLTGEILFDASSAPKGNGSVSKDEMHLAEITHHLGQIPPGVIAAGRYSPKWFDTAGQLRAASSSSAVGILGASVLTPRFAQHDPNAVVSRLARVISMEEARMVASVCLQALSLDPESRATATVLKECAWFAMHPP